MGYDYYSFSKACIWDRDKMCSKLRLCFEQLLFLLFINLYWKFGQNNNKFISKLERNMISSGIQSTACWFNMISMYNRVTLINLYLKLKINYF